MLRKILYFEPEIPDYAELQIYADLDSFIEFHGHLSAANPGCQGSHTQLS